MSTLKLLHPELLMSETIDTLPPIPDHALVKKLGGGGFGVVYLARAATGVHHAVKFVPMGLVSDIEFDGLCVFEKHATDHRNLVVIRHVGRTESWVYYMMELADPCAMELTFDPEDYEPRTLRSDLCRRTRLGLEEAVSITREILRGLAHLHGLGLLHRDVKPSNIMYVKGVVKLADIGLVTRAGHRWNQAASPEYAPPEGARAPSDDLYCLGKTLFELVTGTDPGLFPELPEHLDEDTLDAITRLRPVIDRACSPEPEARFTRAEEFERELDQVMQERAARADAKAVHRTRRRRFAAIFAIAFLLAAVVWGISSYRQGATHEELISVRMRPASETQWARVTPAELPLVIGDRVQVELDVPRTGYVLLLSGNAIGEGRLDERGVQHMYVDLGSLPADEAMIELPTDESWELLEPDGTLTFVMLVADTPVTNPQAIADEVETMGGFPSVHRDRMLVLASDGDIVCLRKGEKRGIVLGEKKPDEPPLLRMLHERFGDRFHTIAAVSVPQATP